MKIGIDISQIVYQTGVSRYTVELVKNLLKIDQKNSYVLYAGSLRQKDLIKSFYQQIKTSKTRLRVSPIKPDWADFVFNRLHFLLIEKFTGDLDIFHSSDWAQPWSKSKKLTTVHDLSTIKFPETHHPYTVAVHQRRLARVKQECDLVIADSQATKKDLVSLLGFDESKIRVVYLAASDTFKSIKNKKKVKQVLDKYNIKPPFIFNLGTLEPRKNLSGLIKSFKKIKTQKSNLQLVISGKFGWGDQVKPVKGVNLTGFVSDEDLASIYSAAECFCYPSLYEGFGLPVLEAMACGCPVITSNVSSLPEVVGEAGLLVNPQKTSQISQSILKVVNNKKLSEQMSKKGLGQAKKFSWEKTAQKTLKVYKELIK